MPSRSRTSASPTRRRSWSRRSAWWPGSRCCRRSRTAPPPPGRSRSPTSGAGSLPCSVSSAPCSFSRPTGPCPCVWPAPRNPRRDSQGLLGDLLDRRLQRGVAAALLLRGHELGHVALDPDLALHERLHPRVRVVRREHLLGGGVVGGERDVGVGRVILTPFAFAVASAHVHLALVAEGRLGDDEVHHHVRLGRRVGAVLLDQLLDLR